MNKLEQIKQITGYNFKDIELLLESLTHPSVRANNRRSKSINYERLEFLGDSVLSLLISEMLFELFPDDNEGHLARRRVALICGNVLSSISAKIGLGELIIMGEAEKRCGEAENIHNLENVMESLIAALYLDGGIDVARAFVNKFWKARAASMVSPPKDAKTVLQEWSQSKKNVHLTYVVVKESGPPHRPIFTIGLRINGYDEVLGKSNTKKAAEQKAAEVFIKKHNIKAED